MCIAIVCQPGCDVIKFEINLTFLIKLFCYMTEKSRQKFKQLENEKSFRGEIKKQFSSFLKGFQLPKIVSGLRVRLLIQFIVILVKHKKKKQPPQRCSIKRVFLEISQNSQENAYVRVSFLTKLIKKVTLAQVFSYEFREISKSTYFTEHLWKLGSHRAINPDSLAKLTINQKLSPKWRQHYFGVNVRAIENYRLFQVI